MKVIFEGNPKEISDFLKIIKTENLLNESTVTVKLDAEDFISDLEDMVQKQSNTPDTTF